MTAFLCALPLVARLAACAAPATLAVGYVEGEYVNLAPVTAATLIEVGPRQGDRVAAGAIVARQERTDAEIALAEAEAARDTAAAELANLREGSRPEEIAVTEASLTAARVRLREAERQATRQTALAERGVVPQADLDTVLAARDTAETEVAQLEAELAVQRLPAREQVLAAAESRLRGAEAAVRDARWRLEQRDLAAPADGQITDVFRRTGEIAGPTAPVMSLLPDGAFKVVAFVGEADVAGIAPGDRLEVRCDGCPPEQAATVSYVSDEPEFTPPVIFSVENRQKLVYRIEAKPTEESRSLRPGQIVDVAHAR
ncbi:HlyD family efflux transporter periplasmic adaptor subunit [Amaricoccus sp.]|uniref:HlyD family secretion protein n=1 Tax=Amaricoccus sp. TaxID=1872485 RepID=UPI0026166298|nr:HlyD family efflux transporter periplasmic adaptor subunit [Amaricoccus sp.]HRO13064.1 HlyD family efflux transporter periplasmic adaptor subunit [Amaricoccus sp.]